MRRLIARAWLVRPSKDPYGDHLLALRLLARVERESRVLAASEQPPRTYVADGRLLIATDLEGPPALPFTLPDATAELGPLNHVLSARAEVVRVGKVEDFVRVRGFYPTAGLTVIAHGWLPLPWPRPRVLHRGAAVAERARTVGSFVVPKPVERGGGFRQAPSVARFSPAGPTATPCAPTCYARPTIAWR